MEVGSVPGRAVHVLAEHASKMAAVDNSIMFKNQPASHCYIIS